MTIPKDRAVLGRDLEAVRQQFALLTSDACWVFGMSITKWTQVVRQGADEEVADPTLALLVRYLADHPETQLIPRFPSPKEMLELLQEVDEIDTKSFAVMWGSEASAGYRWLREDSGIVPGVSRLMYYVRNGLLAAKPEARAAVLEAWRKTVAVEAAARGVPDVFKARSWTRRSEDAANDASGA